MKELTGGRGVDIVYDPIGAAATDESLRCLAYGGRLLVLGFLGGGPASLRSNYLLIKGIEAIGVYMGGLSRPTSRRLRGQHAGVLGAGGRTAS